MVVKNLKINWNGKITNISGDDILYSVARSILFNEKFKDFLNDLPVERVSMFAVDDAETDLLKFKNGKVWLYRGVDPDDNNCQFYGSSKEFYTWVIEKDEFATLVDQTILFQYDGSEGRNYRVIKVKFVKNNVITGTDLVKQDTRAFKIKNMIPVSKDSPLPYRIISKS